MTLEQECTLTCIRHELELGTQCVVEMENQQTILQIPQSAHEKERPKLAKPLMPSVTRLKELLRPLNSPKLAKSLMPSVMRIKELLRLLNTPKLAKS
ncbi:unnamed protein product [Spodoptera exigua]|nr:unnamed protein product [Spodoptera exigua]